MRHLVRPLLLTALAACCGSALAASADQAPNGRLPRWAMPESYNIAFKVDPSQANFSGVTTIKLNLKKASDHLWLDGADLKVSKVTITDAAGKLHTGKYIASLPKAGVARVDFGTTLKPQQLTLTGDHTAPLSQQLQGLYKGNYAGHAYAMTQMEPISARFAFPSFDEPSLATPRDISPTIRRGRLAVAPSRRVRGTW